jgi:hypothetical protein
MPQEQLDSLMDVLLLKAAPRTPPAPAAPPPEWAQKDYTERAEIKSKVKALYEMDPSLALLDKGPEQRAEKRREVLSKIEGIEPTIKDIETKIKEIEPKIKDIETKIKDIERKSDLTGANRMALVEQLKAQLAPLKAQLASLMAQLEPLMAQLEPLKAAYSKLQLLEEYQIKLEAMDDALAKAEPAPEPNKFSTQKLQKEYEDETKKAGWRADDKKDRDEKEYQRQLQLWNAALDKLRKSTVTPKGKIETPEDYQKRSEAFEKKKQENIAKLLTQEPKRREKETEEAWQAYLQHLEEYRESNLRLTKHFTEEERENSKVNFDEQGRAIGKTVKNPDGTVSGPEGPLSGSAEFVMSKTGQMHQFQAAHPETDVEGTNPFTGKPAKQVVSTHHSSVLAGEEVAAAGEMTLNYQGYLEKISNKSGHYRPGATKVIQLLEELARQGALLDKDYVMPGPEGTAVPLEGKPKEIYDTVAKLEAGLDKRLAEGTDIRPQLAAIKEAKQALKELGVTPANKFREVEVTFLGGKGPDKKTGQTFREAEGETSTAKEFLETGGGYQAPPTEKRPEPKKQSVYKEEMHNQLKEKTAQLRVKLDENAEKLAQKVSKDLAELVRTLPQVLKFYEQELDKARNDPSEKGLARVKECLAAIVRVKAASESEPTDVSEGALDKVLADIKAMYEKDKSKAEKIQEWRQEIAEFGSEKLVWGKYGGAEAVAKKLGIKVENLPDDFGGEGDGSFTPDILLENGAIGGCTTAEQLYKKLTEKKGPGE